MLVWSGVLFNAMRGTARVLDPGLLIPNWVIAVPLATTDRDTTTLPLNEPLNPNEQLAWAKWLGEILIGASFEPVEHVGFLTTRSEHDHRDAGVDADFATAYCSEQLCAFYSWHHNVKDDNVWIGVQLGQCLMTGLAVMTHCEFKAGVG